MKYFEEQKTIRQYLLGQLGATESEKLEERVLTDPEYKETVALVEDELIEDFVADELAAPDREYFTRHFLSSPHQLQRLKLAETVHSYFSGITTPALTVNEPLTQPLWKRWRANLKGQAPNSPAARASALIFAILLAGVVVFIASRFLLNKSPTNRRGDLQQKLTRLNDPRLRDQELLKNSPTLQLHLTSDSVRSGEGMLKISIPPDAKVVQFELPASRYPTFTATLRTIEGEEIFTLPSLTATIVDGKIELVTNVPTEFLSPGDYELKLNELSEDGKSGDTRSYYFRVTA